MPIYLYQEILEDGSEGETFEFEHAMSDPPPATHPTTGRPIRRVYAPPRIASRYTPGATRRKLENKNVERAGFTKYVRDKSTGSYHRVAGKEGPSTFKPA